MRPAFLHWLLCIGALSGAPAGISLLQAGDSNATSLTLAEDSPLKCTSNEHTLCFRYEDSNHLLHQFSCQIDQNLARAAENSFGYPMEGEKIRKELDQRLKAEVEAQVRRIAPDIADYIDIGIERHSAAPRSKDPVPWKYWHPISLHSDKLPIHRRMEAFLVKRNIENSLTARKRRIYDSYYLERGFKKGPFVNEKGTPIYEIAYKSIADHARRSLTDCFAEFTRQAGTRDDREIMALLSSFFQEMPVDRPENENDLYKGEFRPPIAVLQRGKGDCDSKAVALCSMWRNPGPQMILLLADLTEEEKASVPPELRANQHAFIGYQSSAGPDTVRTGNAHYTIYEIMRNFDPTVEKLPPGKALTSSMPQRGICLTDDCCGLYESNCRVFKDDSPGAR